MAVKGLMQSDPHDARILKAFALGLAVATRGMDHLRNRVTLEINARINDDPAFKERLYGGPVSAAPNSYESKERAVRVCENTYAVGDSVGMCRFTTKLFNSPSLPGLEEFANQIGNVTGLQFAETELERGRPQHHGRRAPDQRPPRRHAARTTRCRIAGSTSRSRSASTPARRIDRAEFDAMLSRFYEISGLDRGGPAGRRVAAAAGKDARRMTVPRVHRRAIVAALLVTGVIAFTSLFYSHLRLVAETRYVDRDDAVITLSHARNLVEYGFVGVSPSGERIEGFSAPLQFLVAAGVYAIRPFDYHAFFQWQTLIGTVALGAVFAALLLPGPLEGPPYRELLAGAAIVLGAYILANSSAFLWWHASGMENVYKCVALLALIGVLDRMLRRERIWWAAAPLVPLAAITRIDAIVPVGILLATFAALWWGRRRDGRAVTFAIVALTPWLAFMVARRVYFGQWEPNTAAAQSISVAARLAAAVRAPMDSLVDYRDWFSAVGASLFAVQLLWLAPLLWFARRQAAAIGRLALIVAAVVACVVQYAMFGPSRMDPPRTVTELALYATVAGPFVLLGFSVFSRTHLLAGLLVLISAAAAASRAVPHRLDVGWGTPTFEEAADFMERLAASEDLPRPTIANPDLGAVSWRKRFNMVDFGRLGSAVIPKVQAPGVYVAAVALPDIIELHAPWSCFYQEMFQAPAFLERYVRVTAPDPRDAQCPGPTGNHQAYWLRRDVMKGSGTPERRFLDAFRDSFALDLLDRELASCLATPAARPCGYVGRTLFRFAPELRRAGRDTDVAARLLRDPRLRLEHAFFTSASDPLWWHTVIAPGGQS